MLSVHNLEQLERATSERAVDANSGDNDDGIAKWLQNVYATHSFLILVVCAILLAYAYPPLGAIYLVPQITATWIAVVFIFVLAGMGIRTEEFAKAFQRVGFNAFCQIFNFVVVSGIVFGTAKVLVYLQALPVGLTNGMIICSCLPITTNSVVTLTKSAGGDEASATFNAAFGNMAGVFISPALILGYLGVHGDVDLASVFLKLGLRVVLPIVVGQLLRNFVGRAEEFVKRHKKHFKKAQEYCLVFIVYTVFCKTFLNGSDGVRVSDVLLTMALVLGLLTFLMGLAWISLKLLFRSEPKLQAMGLFGCTHKTVSMGVSLINAIYERDPMVGLYTLPLLIWHPMQLVLGTAIAPRVAEYVENRENELVQCQQQQEEQQQQREEDNFDENAWSIEVGGTDDNANDAAKR